MGEEKPLTRRAELERRLFRGLAARRLDTRLTGTVLHLGRADPAAYRAARERHDGGTGESGPAGTLDLDAARARKRAGS